MNVEPKTSITVTAQEASALLQLRGCLAVVDNEGDVWTRWRHDDERGFGCGAIWRAKLPEEYAPYTPLVPADQAYVAALRDSGDDRLATWRAAQLKLNTCGKCGCTKSHVENFDELTREGDVICDNCGAFIRTWGIG